MTSGGSDEEPELLLSLVEDPSSSEITRHELGHNIYQHDASGFTVIIRQQYAVHGTWAEDPDNKTFASLLVFRVELNSQSPKQNRRFKHVSLKLRFERDPLLAPADDPVVKCFEPAQGVVITQLPTEVTRSRERNVEGEATVNANPVPANTTIRYTSKDSWSWQKHDRVRIAGIAKMTPSEDGERLGDDRVEWSFQENPREKEIPDSYGLAILLQRSDSSKFKVTFEVKARVDFWYTVATIIETFNGWQKKSRSYDPSSQGKCPEGVGPKNLGRLAQGLELFKFSFNHLPEEVKPIGIYTEGD